jgi:hypothetical protein
MRWICEILDGLLKAVDPVLKLGALAGGIFALWKWTQDQRWRRAEQLDKLIKEFGDDENILLATQCLDWNKRKVSLKSGKEIIVSSDELIAALRVPSDPDFSTFPYPQSKIRDALDALLAFFGRLELAIEGGFIEEEYTISYFGYWIERMRTMSQHSKRYGDAPDKMRKYMREYGPDELIKGLFRRTHPG